MAAVRRSPLALIVLSMLSEEPMHPYRMQRQLEAQGKDRVVNVRARATLYQTIERLQRHGLIAVRRTEKGTSHPDRDVYEITAAGRETARAWVSEALESVGGDFPEFPAAVSVLTLLAPAEVRDLLARRADRVGAALAETRAQLRAASAVPALFLLEEDYRLALLRAEQRWLQRVVADLDAGTLHWSAEWLREVAARLGSSS